MTSYFSESPSTHQIHLSSTEIKNINNKSVEKCASNLRINTWLPTCEVEHHEVITCVLKSALRIAPVLTFAICILPPASDTLNVDNETQNKTFHSNSEITTAVTALVFLPPDATYSAIMSQYVVCLSVCLSVRLSVRGVQVPWSHKLEYFENNFTADWLKVNDRDDPNIGDLVQREHPQN